MKRMREIAAGKKSVRALILAMVCLVMVGMTPMIPAEHEHNHAHAEVQETGTEHGHVHTMEECVKGSHDWESQEGCCENENLHESQVHSPVYWHICTVCKKIEIVETGDIAPLAEVVPAVGAVCTSP